MKNLSKPFSLAQDAPYLHKVLADHYVNGQSQYLHFHNGCLIRGKKSWGILKCFYEGDVVIGTAPVLKMRARNMNDQAAAILNDWKHDYDKACTVRVQNAVSV